MRCTITAAAKNAAIGIRKTRFRCFAARLLPTEERAEARARSNNTSPEVLHPSLVERRSDGDLLPGESLADEWERRRDQDEEEQAAENPVIH